MANKSGERLKTVKHKKFDFTVDGGKKLLNHSRDKNKGMHRRRKMEDKSRVWPSSCVTPAGTSNEHDVQNKWEEKTHTNTTHSSRVLSGDGLVGGNPTMNTPRLRRGGGIASSSSLV